MRARRRRVKRRAKRRAALAKHTFTSLFRRLSQAGYKKEFVRSAILPAGWDDTSEKDPGLLDDVDVRVAQFLGISLETVRDANSPIEFDRYPAAQLRRVRSIERDRLSPAIHTAIRVASAVARTMRLSGVEVSVPPADPRAWRQELLGGRRNVTLPAVLDNLWNRGIPVVNVNLLPSPKFQGFVCVVESRPVVVLGQGHDEPGRVAFIVAHEVGHAAHGDCAPDQPIVDEDDEILDDANIELRADKYAKTVLLGDVRSVPWGDGLTFKQLAQAAVDLERETGAEASTLIYAWARETGDYGKATMAVKALYLATGAKSHLQRHFEQHIDLDAASETDRALLRCVQGLMDHDELAD